MPADSPEFEGSQPRSQRQRLQLLLLDDHPVVRAGLHALLALESDFEVLGEASEADEAIALTLKLRPDILISDITLGEKNGIYLIAKLRELAPRTSVLVLTVHRAEEYVKAALSAGACGYVLKDSDRADLLRAVRAVGAGKYYLSPPISETVVSRYLSGCLPDRPVMAGELADQVSSYSLTEREQEILMLVAQGKRNKHIARELHLSVKTVAKHRANFMSKLDLHNSAAVARFAVAHGMSPADAM